METMREDLEKTGCENRALSAGHGGGFYAERRMKASPHSVDTIFRTQNCRIF